MVRDITTLLTVLGFGVLFVIFGMLQPRMVRCSGCSCGSGPCREHGVDATEEDGS